MASLVVYLVSASCKCPVTIPAFVRFFPGVGSYVVAQRCLLRKLLAAARKCAVDLVDSRVNVPMSFQGGQQLECF